MAKYQIDTDGGTFEVETEDAPAVDPVHHSSSGNVARAGTSAGPYKNVANSLDMLSNVPSSTANIVKGATELAKPDTWKSFGKTIIGGLQKMTPDTPSHGNRQFIPNWDAVVAGQGDRYGSMRALGTTLTNDPAGVASDASAVAGGVSGAMRGAAGGARMLRLPRVASGMERTANTAAAVSDASNPLLYAGRALSQIPIPEKFTPRGLYGSALKIPAGSASPAERDAVVSTGIREGIPASRGGFDEAGKRVDALNGEIANKIAGESERQGAVVQPREVAAKVEDIRPTFSEQVNPSADVASLEKSKQEFLDKHSIKAPYTKIEPNPYSDSFGGFVPTGEGVTKIEQPFTLSQAQAEKTGTYRQLRKKYGELGSADVEAQKQLARGLKDEIAKRVPGLSELNARDAALIELEQRLSRFVAREGNKNTVGLIPAVLSGGSETGLLATLAMDNPYIKSQIAIVMDRAKKLKGAATNTARTVNAAGSAGNALYQGKQ